MVLLSVLLLLALLLLPLHLLVKPVRGQYDKERKWAQNEFKEIKGAGCFVVHTQQLQQQGTVAAALEYWAYIDAAKRSAYIPGSLQSNKLMGFN